MKIDPVILKYVSHRCTVTNQTFSNWWYLEDGGYAKILLYLQLFQPKLAYVFEQCSILSCSDYLLNNPKEDINRSQINLKLFIVESKNAL